MPKRWMDGLWLLVLSAYVLLGMPTFHGDEAMLIYASKDFNTALVEGKPWHLTTQPPYGVDSDAHLRILNGSISIYTMGLSLFLQNLDAQRPTSLWQWWLSYDENVAEGKRPSAEVLQAARLPSALFFCASIGVMFALARQFGVAYLASFLYALQPALLLNGRRAMHEGVWLFFGLSTLYLAAYISQKEQVAKKIWLLFAVLCGLTLTSKHSGVVYVAVAMGWVFFNRLPHYRHIVVYGLAVGCISLLIFIALSPALWNNPPARLRNLLQVRGELLDSQVQAHGATTLGERLAGILTQPYLAEVQHYETDFWGNSANFQAEVEDYQGSFWRGLQLPTGLGILMTGCMLFGIAIVMLGRPFESSALTVGLLTWLGVVLLTLIINPLPWQRYYLPLFPLASLFTALGMTQLPLLIKKSSGEH